MLIGSNCCGCDNIDSNNLRFNCNEITDSKGDFSMDVSKVSIPYIDIDRSNTTLKPVNESGDLEVVEHDFLIFQASEAISIYDSKPVMTSLNLKGIIKDIVIDDFFIDVKYDIRKIFPSSGSEFIMNNDEFDIKFYDADSIVTNAPLSNNARLYSGDSLPSMLLVADKTHRIPVSPDDTEFDLHTYKWEEKIIFNNIEFKISLSVGEAGTHSVKYLESNVEVIKPVTYSEDYLKMNSVAVSISNSVFSKLALKDTPFDFYDIKEDDLIDSYYSIGLFGNLRKIGSSSFGMFPLTSPISLVNEGKNQVKLGLIKLIV